MTTTAVLSVKEGIEGSALREAGKLLREGKLVAFPTETVYGLGVHAENREAVERLYEVKGRPKEKALTLAIAGYDDLKTYNMVLSPIAKRLIERFWPGPLTLLLRNDKGEKIGVRMPGHPVAKGVLEAAGIPIGLPSANPSGKVPPRSAEEVLAYFDGVIDLVLDGGRTEFGVSSTVVDLAEPRWGVVREGTISRKEIEWACRGLSGF